MTDFLFNFSLPFATVGLLAFLLFSYRSKGTEQHRSKIFAVATISSLISFICLTLLLPLLFLQHGSEAFMLIWAREILYAWFIMVIYFVAEFRYRIRLLGSILMPVALLLLLMATFEEQTPVQTFDMRGIPTILHVVLVLGSFALVFLSFAAASLFLIKTRTLKKSPEVALDNDLPAVVTLKKLMHTSFLIGFPLLTLGLILGSIYAGAELSPGWYKHPFMIMAGGIWCLYAVLFYLYHRGLLISHVFARGVVVLFVLIVILTAFSTHRSMFDEPGANIGLKDSRR